MAFEEEEDRGGLTSVLELSGAGAAELLGSGGNTVTVSSSAEAVDEGVLRRTSPCIPPSFQLASHVPYCCCYACRKAPAMLSELVGMVNNLVLE